MIVTLHDAYKQGDKGVMFLWRLLKEREPAQNISHDGNPVWEKHVDWVKAKPYPYWYIIANAAGRVGMIYLTGAGEIGIQIAKQHHRKGYARAAVAELMKRHPRTHYLANVAPGNGPSHAFWQGYRSAKVIQHTYRLTNEEQRT